MNFSYIERQRMVQAVYVKIYELTYNVAEVNEVIFAVCLR